jgi:iron complex transport system substrate-binding protein
MEYLGLTHLLVAVDDFSDWPIAINDLPKIGPDLSINMELVEKLGPDLVLASLSVPGMERNVEELVKRGIPHIVLNPQSLDDIESDLLLVAETLGVPEKGKIASNHFRNRLDLIIQKSSTVKSKPTLYWEWWPKPIFTPGKINWLTEISEAAGAINIFSDIELASVQTDWQDVLNRKPNYICLAWVGVNRKKIQKSIVTKRPGYKNLDFNDDSKILILEEELYCRPSPRLLEGLEKLFHLIH